MSGRTLWLGVGQKRALLCPKANGWLRFGRSEPACGIRRGVGSITEAQRKSPSWGFFIELSKSARGLRHADSPSSARDDFWGSEAESRRFQRAKPSARRACGESVRSSHSKELRVSPWA